MIDKTKLRMFSANKVKYYREKEGMTQDELAEKVSKQIGKEVKRQTISLYENGERGMNQDILFTLADIFNISINDFFPDTTNKENKDYKQILKDKGLMDENDNIDEKSLNKLLEIADMIKGYKKED